MGLMKFGDGGSSCGQKHVPPQTQYEKLGAKIRKMEGTIAELTVEKELLAKKLRAVEESIEDLRALGDPNLRPKSRKKKNGTMA